MSEDRIPKRKPLKLRVPYKLKLFSRPGTKSADPTKRQPLRLRPTTPNTR
jgi:hypothetical protein